MKVGDLINGGGLLALAPTVSVQEAARTMAAKRCGAILVIDQGKLSGIFSERDLMNRVVAPGLDPIKVPLGEVMTRDVLTAQPEMSIEEGMRIMYRKRLRHLPVTDVNGTAIGMLGLRDVMDFIVRNLYGEK